jgi:hypothetical protein
MLRLKKAAKIMNGSFISKMIKLLISSDSVKIPKNQAKI